MNMNILFPSPPYPENSLQIHMHYSSKNDKQNIRYDNTFNNQCREIYHIHASRLLVRNKISRSLDTQQKMDVADHCKYGDTYDTYASPVQDPHDETKSINTKQVSLTGANSNKAKKVSFDEDNSKKPIVTQSKPKPNPTPPPPPYPYPKKDNNDWTLDKTLGEITSVVKRDFFNRSDGTVETYCKWAEAKIHSDTKLVITAYMQSLVNVFKRDLAEAPPKRLVEIKYFCPVFCLDVSRDLEYVTNKGIYYTVGADEVSLVCDILRYKIRRKYGVDNNPERFIEVVVRTVPKKWVETVTTLPTSRVIQVFICNLTQMYTRPPVDPEKYDSLGFKSRE